jgi:hypothetical protein
MKIFFVCGMKIFFVCGMKIFFVCDENIFFIVCDKNIFFGFWVPTEGGKKVPRGPQKPRFFPREKIGHFGPQSL